MFDMIQEGYKEDFRLYFFEAGTLKKLHKNFHKFESFKECQDVIPEIKNRFKYIEQVVIVKYTDAFKARIIEVI